MPVRIKYLKKENGMQRGSLSIRSWRTQCGLGYSLAVMTQIVKEYLACSWQLTADGFYLHTDFPHYGSRSFTFAFGWRLTFPSLWHFPFPIVSDVLSQNRHSDLSRHSLKPVSSVRLRRPPPYKQGGLPNPYSYHWNSFLNTGSHEIL